MIRFKAEEDAARKLLECFDGGAMKKTVTGKKSKKKVKKKKAKRKER